MHTKTKRPTLHTKMNQQISLELGERGGFGLGGINLLGVTKWYLTGTRLEEIT